MNRQACINTKIKTVVFFTAVFFIFYDASYADISSSKNYKLYTAVIDDGGMATSSTSYSSESTIGGPLASVTATGAKYKVYGGALSTMNSLPNIEISSHNDGSLISDATPTLKWSYEDKDDDPQRYYQVQISKDNFSSFMVDSGLIESSDNNFTVQSLTTDGSYRWRVRASDGFDYSGWTVATDGFKLATGGLEIPVIWAKVSSAGDEIAAKLWQSCGDPYMYWEYPVTGVDIVGYSYAWSAIPDDQVDTTGISYQTPVDLLSDGVRVFNLKGQNTAGTWSEVASFEIWIDRSAPKIGTYVPINGTIINTDTPTVSINVSDEFSGINSDGVTLKLNKSNVNATYDKDSKKVIYIPSIPLSEGDNVISLEVSDIVGNKTSPIVWSFVVDTKPPSGSVIINDQDAVTNSIYVYLNFSAADSTTGLKSMVISNDGVFDTEQWENFSVRKEDWQLPAISGTRKVYVKFKDKAGNESEIFNDTIELIIIAPDTIITSGPSMLTSSKDALFTFKGTAEQCVFRWKFDNEEWSDWSTQTSVSAEDLSEGNHYFKVQAAKDVNNNGKIDADEMDPVPEERTWTIGDKDAIKPDIPKKKPFRFWKEE